MANNPKTEQQPMSMQELLCCQVYGLVRETADAMCPKGQNVLEVEADLLNALAVNCAAKRDLAKMLASGGKD